MHFPPPLLMMEDNNYRRHGSEEDHLALEVWSLGSEK